jgi:hypothetical protein
MYHVVHGVPWYHLVPWYSSTLVPWYVPKVPWYVHVYQAPVPVVVHGDDGVRIHHYVTHGTLVWHTMVHVHNPKHTWFSVHMRALFPSESCDITL